MTATDTPIDLDEFLAGPEPDYDTDPTPDALADSRKATAILRHLGTVRARLAEREHEHDIYRDQLTEWITTERHHLGQRIQWLETWLAGWHGAQIERGAELTVRLPSGTLTARKLPDSVDFDDEVFIEWALANGDPQWVRELPPVIDKRTAKRAMAAYRVTLDGRVVDDMGEIIPGVTVIANRGRSYTATTHTPENQP